MSRARFTLSFITVVLIGTSTTAWGQAQRVPTVNRQTVPDPNTANSATADSGAIDVKSDVEAGSDEQLSQLRTRVQQCLDIYFHKHEDVARRSPWGVMHALIPYGVDSQLLASGRKVNAIGWLCWNQPCRGTRMMSVQNGQLNVHQGPGVQGHAGQFLAILAQSRVPLDYTMKVSGGEFTLHDLVKYEQATCRPGTELTFKLIGMAHYLDSDTTWKCNRGETWDIPRLIKEELKQPVIGAACGGTHRLMGFSYAISRRQRQERPFEGQWSRAKKYIDDYRVYTMKLQNGDGSFSTNWFEGRGQSPGVERRLQTSGHILEWLVYSTPEEQLRDPQLVKSVDYLASLLLKHQSTTWEVGPLGHALHALAIYDRRVFGTKPGHRNLRLAQDSNNME